MLWNDTGYAGFAWPAVVVCRQDLQRHPGAASKAAVRRAVTRSLTGGRGRLCQGKAQAENCPALLAVGGGEFAATRVRQRAGNGKAETRIAAHVGLYGSSGAHGTAAGMAVMVLVMTAESALKGTRTEKWFKNMGQDVRFNAGAAVGNEQIVPAPSLSVTSQPGRDLHQSTMRHGIQSIFK